MRKSVEKVINSLKKAGVENEKIDWIEKSSDLSVDTLKDYAVLMKRFPDCTIDECSRWLDLMKRSAGDLKFPDSKVSIQIKNRHKRENNGARTVYIPTIITKECEYLPLSSILDFINTYKDTGFYTQTLADMAYFRLTEEQVRAVSDIYNKGMKKFREHVEEIKKQGYQTGGLLENTEKSVQKALITGFVKDISYDTMLELCPDIIKACIYCYEKENFIEQDAADIIAERAGLPSARIKNALYAWSGNTAKYPLGFIQDMIRSKSVLPDMSDDEKNRIKDLVGTLGADDISLTANVPYYNVTVKRDHTSFRIELMYGKAEFTKHCRKPNLVDIAEKDNIVVYNDGDVYIQRTYKWTNTPFRKMTLKDVASMYITYGSSLPEVFDAFMSKKAGTGLYDVYQEIKKGYIAMPPVAYCDCVGLRTKSEIMHLYKDVADIDYNKRPISAAYMIKTALPHFKKEDRSLIIQYFSQGKYDSIVDDLVYIRTESARRIGKDAAKKILAKTNNINFEAVNIRIVLSDYVDECINMGKKLKLKMSYNKILEEHLRQQHEMREWLMRNDPEHQIVMPKNSVFKRMSRRFPKDFEWITDSDRIVKEGIDMNHCVATYASQVTADECAIYHLTYKKSGSEYDGKPYTIEVRRDSGGHYFLNQAQSPHDRGCPDEVWDYVNSYISKENEAFDKISASW